MNKMKSVVIACLMVLFTLGAIMPASAATTTVSIDPATVTSDACETVSIMIQTDDAAGIGSATMTLVYNPAVVTYDSKVADGGLGAVTIGEPVAGTLNMVAATGANPGPTGTVKFVDLKFCPVGAPEACSDLDLTVTELTDGNVAVIVPDSVTDGQFCIPAAVAPGTDVYVDPATVTSDTCETVSIMIDTDEAAGIGSATMTLVYNPAVVTYDSKVADGGLGAVTIGEPVAGTLNMVAATGANPGPTGTVKFVDLKFCPVGAPEACSDLDLTVTELTDGNVAVIVPDSVTDGQFCIPAAVASGTDVYVDPATVTSDTCETVSIMIDTDEAAGIGSATMTLVYNPAVVTYDSKVADGDLGAVTVFEPVAGTLNMVAATGANPGPTGTVKFVDLKFCQVGAIVDCSDLDLTVTELTDGNVVVIIPDTVTDGEFCTSVPNDPPTATVIYPNGGETLSGTTISASATDTDGTIASVVFSYSPDNGASWTGLGAGTPVGGDSYEYDWDTTTVPDGTQYLIRALATDNVGATGVDESNAVFTVFNNDPPAPRITSPADGSTVSDTVSVVAVDDSGDEPADIEYALFEYYNDSNCNCIADDGDAWVEIYNDTSSAGGWSAVWDTALIPDCCHLIRVTMADGIGQNGSDQINVNLSNHAPMPNVTAPSDGDVISGSASINAVDESFESGADIVYCLFEYYYDENCNCAEDDGNEWFEIYNDTDGTDGWSTEWDMLPDGVAAYPNGCYMIRAAMGDMHGRNGSAEINVDLSNPDFCLDLEEGWNFVSIPKRINGSNGAVGVFNLVQGETCLHYDGCAEGWLSNYQINVVPCQGYWVYKVADEKICVYFDPGTGQSVPSSQNLCEGWNMIGHIDTSSMPIDDGSIADFGSITTLEGKFAQVCQWTQDDGYKCYPYPPGELTHMTPGQGYWILVEEDATMYGTL